MVSETRDPLTDVLALLRPEAAVAAELRAYGRWALSFDADPGVKFGVVVRGQCLIAVRGRSAKVFRSGDVFLLGGPPPFLAASDLEAPRRSAEGMLRDATRVVEVGDPRAKPAVHVIGGRFNVDPANADLLVKALPALVRIPADEAGPLRSVSRLLVDEVRSSQHGRLRALDQLAQLLLAYALRWLDARGQSPARRGWLRALADARIAAALSHIHSSVKGGTSMTELARVARMSRTAFVARFRELVGQPPFA